VLKAPTTKPDPLPGIGKGLELVGDQLQLDMGEMLRNMSLLVHGTTVATNAVIE